MFVSNDVVPLGDGGILTPQYTSTIEARSNLGAQPRDETELVTQVTSVRPEDDRLASAAEASKYIRSLAPASTETTLKYKLAGVSASLPSLSCGKLVQPPAIHCVDPLHPTGAFGLVFDWAHARRQVHYDLELNYCQTCQVIPERGPAIARAAPFMRGPTIQQRLCDKADK